MVDAAVDAMVDAPVALTCMDRWRAGTVNLSTPTLIAEIDSVSVDRDPFVSDDELTIFFSSERSVDPGDSRIYAATRASASAAFDTPAVRGDISGDAYDSRFTMTSTERIAVLASRRSGAMGGSSDLWLTTRGSPSASFQAPSASLVADLNTNQDELDPELSDDGLRLYFARGTPQRIYAAARAATNEAFAAAEEVTALGSVGNQADADPAVSADDRVLLFSSRRDGGVADIWYARRASATQPFGDVKKVPGVNTSAEDGDPALSADGCTLYFASNRNSGDWEIFASRVAP